MSGIIIKSGDELRKIREGGRMLAGVLGEIKKLVVPGISPYELDGITEDMIRENGGRPAFKGYAGFPSSLCVSINEEVVHGIPGKRQIREGDIVSVDMGVELNGYYADMAATFPAGRVSPEVAKLMRVTEEALYVGIEKARAVNRLQDISHAIQLFVEENGFSVVRDYSGHGIGSSLHEEPQVPNFGKVHKGPQLSPGMVLAIEPMVNMGGFEVRVMQDGWTVVTKDRKPSAHFEHTVAITEGAAEILTF